MTSRTNCSELLRERSDKQVCATENRTKLGAWAFDYAVTVMDWDDLRIFAAVAREGSIRAASRVLQINNATVSRRIRGFEERLGARLFDRTPGGYAITAVGEEILAAATRIEEEVNGVERRVLGQDARLSGDIKFTAPHSALLRLLMADLAAFMELYPDVTLELDMSYEVANLSAREADVALRVTRRPPEHLIGRKVAQIAQAAYATPAYLAAHDLVEKPAAARWIGWNDFVPHPEWVCATGRCRTRRCAPASPSTSVSWRRRRPGSASPCCRATSATAIPIWCGYHPVCPWARTSSGS